MGKPQAASMPGKKLLLKERSLLARTNLSRSCQAALIGGCARHAFSPFSQISFFLTRPVQVGSNPLCRDQIAGDWVRCGSERQHTLVHLARSGYGKTG